MDKQRITVMIGRNGTARHRALATITETDPGKPWNRKGYKAIQMTCSCPGSQNGRAYHGIRVIADGWDNADCRAKA